MSWLNNSLNTIKGQLTNLAQEVLADTAGPGDDEYRGNESNTKTMLELLTETQQQKQQLDKVCEEQNREIDVLRKQIATLKDQNHSKSEDDANAAASGQHRETKSTPTGEEQNVEDSWCWEPAGQEAASTTSKGTADTGMVDIALGGTTDVSKLNATIALLEEQNEQLRESLNELDAQHDQAMQDVLGHKTQLQRQLTDLKQLQTDRLVEHELAMARLQTQLSDEQKRLQAKTREQEQLQQRVAEQEGELQRSVLELAEMQQLLEKRGIDNGELIERVRQVETEREKLQRELDELAKLVKEKKTSESSNSSSTGKHSEDEFIVVRNADAAGSGSASDPDADTDATTPPTKEKLRDKLVSLEARIAELTASNLKLRDGELEQLQELETRLRISESEKEQLQLELQRKLQQLVLQNQELKLNAEADQETHANDLEQQLGSLRSENRQLRQELDTSIAQAKFRQAIAEEKQEITDLDFDLDNDLRSLLETLLTENSKPALERTHRLLNERYQRLEAAEQRMLDMQDQQLMAEHEKKTLEADISQYILQCDELMKNNELLLNELDKFKRNKLETIEEHHEETIAQLETQLEEAQSQLQRQQQQLESTQHSEPQLKVLQLQLEQLKEHPVQSPQMEQLNQQLSELQTVKARQQQQLTEQQRQLKQLKAQEKATKQQTEQQNLALEELQSELDAKQAELEQLQLQLKAQREAAEQAKHKAEQLEQLEALTIELQDKLEQREIKLRESVESTKELKTQLAAAEQPLKEQLNEQLNERIDSQTAQLEQLQATLASKETLLAEQTQRLQAQLEEKQLQLLESTQQSELLQSQLEQLRAQLTATSTDSDQLEQLTEQLQSKEQQLVQLRAQLDESASLQQTLDTLNKEKLELIKVLQQKHAENTQYYAEIQRLQPLEQQLAELLKEHEKQRDQISFLKEKSDILTTNLLTEQTNQRLLQQQQLEAQEQQANVLRDLERLRAHLLEVEELHTQETVQLQRDLDEARAKQESLQKEASKSSTAYTSASIRANQQAETLQAQHGLLLQQRDELLAKLGQNEDRELKQQAALTNLQCALEQFQNDKQHDIEMATQRMRRELQAEREKQALLQAEMAALQQKLAEANQGLRAAARLSDQLETGQQAIAVLREEVDSLKDVNVKLKQSLSSSESSQTDKIDKSLIKSLLIGYVVSGHAGDKQQVLRMISSVLDFSAQESDKVGLNKSQTSWLGNILGGGQSSGASPGNENLVQAFVQFLEQESQPQSKAQTRPTLLSMGKQVEAAPPTAAAITSATITSPATATTAAAIATPAAATTTTTTTSSSSSDLATPAMQSMLMSSNEFAPTRNSSSILKDILSDS